MASQRNDPTPTSLVANDSDARWKVLLAHDGTLPTCDALMRAVTSAIPDAQILDATSSEAARTHLRRTAVDVCFVCLDLPPSPSGGIKLAQELVRVGLPVVLITRSLRWLPKSAAELRVLPWVAPEAPATDVVRAIDEAVGQLDTTGQITFDSSELAPEDGDSLPPRLSEV